MEKVLYVISHTHWDREWYQTFQQYRKRLVRMLDDLIEVLENDADFKHFHLDGQTIVIEDYLQIRPQNKERLYKLIRDKRIIIGPWYVMPDEFLVSGESLIRNLQKGIGQCEDIGTEYMKSGYVTDLFGHNSQLPQILSGFDINNAVLFRGIADYKKDTFIWQGADGSEVITSKLDKNRAYSNFYFAVRWPFDERDYDEDEMVERMKKLLSYYEDMQVSDVLLMMDGVDHIDAEPQLPKFMKLLEKRIDGIKFIHSTYEDYIKAQMDTKPELETIKGPLYNLGQMGMCNFLLKNVLSSMVNLKQENDLCETMLTRWAEPLDFACGMMNGRLKQTLKFRNMEPRKGFFVAAWEELIKNHPHDSICGCSRFEVHMDNEYRFRQAKDITLSIVDDTKETLSHNIDTTGRGTNGAVVVFNAGQNPFNRVVLFDLKTNTGCQCNFKFYDIEGNEIPYQIIGKKSDLEKESTFRELIRFNEGDLLTIAMKVSLPAMGYSTYTMEEFVTVWPSKTEYTYPVYYPPTKYLGTLRTGINSFNTGKIEVVVNSNGTLKVTSMKTSKIYDNVLAFENNGDTGDGWNYKKPLLDSSYISTCSDASFSIEADGPLAAIIKIVTRMILPSEIDGKNPNIRSKHRDTFEIESLITIKKDSSKIDVKTVVYNEHLEHRLRVLIPTDINNTVFYTKTPFDMQEWNVKKADWSNFQEVETNVNPSQGITLFGDSMDSILLTTKGLYEVELTDNKSKTLALTLFRTFPNEAGFKSQNSDFMKKKYEGEFSIDFRSPTTPNEALIEGEDSRSGISVFKTKNHEGILPKETSFVKIDSDENSVVFSSVVRESIIYKGEKFDTLRLFNSSTKSSKATVELPVMIMDAFIVDLLGSKTGDIKSEGKKLFLELGAKKILTVAFRTHKEY